MSIQIVDSFKLNLNKPIDSRMVTTGIVSRNSIKYTYEGLRVYDIVDKATYVFIDGLWQKENSVVSSTPGTGVSGGGGSSIPLGTSNRIVKYINSTTVGDSSIIDKSIGATINVGIGMAPLVGMALDIKGMFRATRFLGKINGSQIDIASIDTSKIIPHNIAVGEFALKTIGGVVIWTAATSLNTDIVINNETSATGTHYLLFSSTANNTTTGVPIYANDASTTRFIGIKPSTSQILGSGDSTNNSGYPSYAFSGTTNAGLYGNNTEVGLSFNGNALLKLNSTKLSIFDTSSNEVLGTGTGKVTFMAGEFSTTINVTGLATFGSLNVSNTGTTTFTSLSTTTLTTTGLATFASLNVSNTGTTTFTSLSTTTLNTTGLATFDSLDVSGLTEISNLSLTKLDVPNATSTLINLRVTVTSADPPLLTPAGNYAVMYGSYMPNNQIIGPLTITPEYGNTLLINGRTNFNGAGVGGYGIPISLSTRPMPNNQYATTAELSSNGVLSMKKIYVDEVNAGSSKNENGTLITSKVCIYKSARSAGLIPFNYNKYWVDGGDSPLFYINDGLYSSDWKKRGEGTWPTYADGWRPINGTKAVDPSYLVYVSYQRPYDNQTPIFPPTSAGYEPGDIVYVQWVISGSGLNAVVGGEFCFYTGRARGWVILGDQGFVGYADPLNGGTTATLPSPPPSPGASPGGAAPYPGGNGGGGIAPNPFLSPSPGVSPTPGVVIF